MDFSSHLAGQCGELPEGPGKKSERRAVTGSAKAGADFSSNTILSIPQGTD